MSPFERGVYGRTETPDQAVAMADMRRAGVSVGVIAQTFGIPRRTVYRAIQRANRTVVWIACGAWRAQFAMTEVGPVQVCGWLPRDCGRRSGDNSLEGDNATPEDGGVQSPHQRSRHESIHSRTSDDVRRNRDAITPRGEVRSDA